jgi:hypothetical protein
MTHPTVASILLPSSPPTRPAPLVNALATPVRNRYFYGKLLDEMHLEMEQSYFIDKRWLLNRLGLGAGVMCGLTVSLTADKQKVLIDPGVALDTLGREIIVPQRTRPIDPRRLTDDCGSEIKPPLDGAATVLVGVGYHECDTEPTPALACECDDDGCQYGAVRERYTVIVERGELPGDRRICDRLFTPGAGSVPADVWSARMARIGGLAAGCGTGTECPWVPLALLTVEADGTVSAVDVRVRVPVVSNVMLLNLILCLASELDVCCGGGPPPVDTLTLTALDPTQFVATAGQLVQPRPKVRVDRNGTPSDGEHVTWSVGPNDGKVAANGPETGSVTTVTANGGIGELPVWRAPNQGGVAKLTASVAGATPGSVDFTLKVEAGVMPPRILAMWPPNGSDVRLTSAALDASGVKLWLKRPFVDLTFDRDMVMAELQADPALPDAWLRAALVEGSIALHTTAVAVLPAGRLRPLTPRFQKQVAAIGGQAGSTYRFILTDLDLQGLTNDFRNSVLVMVRAENGNITAMVDGQLLDAEFDARLVDPQNVSTPLFGELWKAAAPGAPPIVSGLASLVHLKIMQNTVPTTLVQSGDGVPGGLFHGYFGVHKP